MTFYCFWRALFVVHSTKHLELEQRKSKREDNGFLIKAFTRKREDNGFFNTGFYKEAWKRPML